MYCRFQTIVIVLCFAGAENTAVGQQDFDGAEKIAPAAPQSDSAENAAQKFQQIAFGRFGNAAAARARLEERLSLRLEAIERVCGINVVQRKKIELAGKGDIKRFFDAIEANRRRVQAAGEDEFERIQQELAASARSIESGLLDEKSFFVKTMKTTLSAEQLALYDDDRRRSRMLQHEAQVKAVVGVFERAIGLDDEQRRRLNMVLMAETRPLKISAEHQAECLFVLAQAVNLPEAKLGPIFTAMQRRAADRLIAELKNGLASELKSLEAAESGAPTGMADNAATDAAVKPGAKASDSLAIPVNPANANDK